MKKRVLLAGLFHQTNIFVGELTEIGDFEVRRGEEILRMRGDTSPVDGVVQVARSEGWELLQSLDLRALSGAIVSDEVVELFWYEFRQTAEAESAVGVDGIFLMFHGAMVSETFADVEGEVLRRIRSLPGFHNAPICGVVDLHANLTDAMARQADGLIAYRDDLGMDAKEAARDASLLLDGLMRTETRPTTIREHPPIMWPFAVAVTDAEPMRTLEDRARQLENRLPDVHSINVLAGFPYSDIPEAGICFSAIVEGDLELARSALRELNVLASIRRASRLSTLSLHEAITRLEDHAGERPVLLLEIADDVGAGAPGDDTRLLEALLDLGLPDAGMILNDPESVALLANACSGDLSKLELGGKSEGTSKPLSLEVELLLHSDNLLASVEDDDLTTLPYEMRTTEPWAIVRVAGVKVLLTSSRVPVLNLKRLARHLGLADFSVIVLKTATGYRLEYSELAHTACPVDLIGPTSEDLRRLPFRRVCRPIYPLDPM